MKYLTRVIAFLSLWSCLFAVCAAPVMASRVLTVDIHGPGQNKANIYLAPPLSGLEKVGLPAEAASLEKAIRYDFGFLPFLHPEAPEHILGGPDLKGATGTNIDFKRFQLSKVDLLVSTAWTETLDERSVELRVYEVFTGKLLLGKAYSNIGPDNVALVADRFCADLMRALTGQAGFFQSSLAFSRSSGKKRTIWQVSATGRRLRQLTTGNGKAMSPSFAPDGNRLVYSHVSQNGHRLGIWERGKEPRLIKLRGNSVIGPTFTPTGKVALTLDMTGQPDLYLLGSDYKGVTELSKSWAIDVSPSFDASGNLMAFASGRAGNPHIFLLDRETGKVRRITYDGKYNTNPSISPDGKLIVFSHDTPGGHRLFLHDLASGMEKQLTFGPGSDETPVFSPDGYHIAFSSSRSGEYKIYITTRYGDTPVLVDTGPGDAKSPAWGPAMD
jgi:TolB protein